MDILLSAANAALLLAHGIRRDAEVGLLLLGPPGPPRLVRLVGFRLRSYQPDIRANAALIRRALVEPSRIERESTPGVFSSIATFEEAVDRLGPPFVSLHEGGKDIRTADLPMPRSCSPTIRNSLPKKRASWPSAGRSSSASAR